ncbi:Uncharacterized conserved protein [Candidatus Ornithobacterium hominis]|uniref:YkvA family protein n=1 Tax=Candidatus Ornithobacterium hominis TaxID=2497989 RepID=UPI000E5AD21D|nr:YkvA family protein [Candidatus Ornithobacterium hominis]SZD73760.1 Uncharacterized conserved protein [Candidatus Ornithobacterium hominis]
MGRSRLLYQIWRNRKDMDSNLIKSRLQALSRMIPLIYKGEYKPKSNMNIIIGVVAALYAVSPLDFIPEIVAGPFGLLDDFFILGYGLKRINAEIENFLAWEDQQKKIILQH